MPMNLKKLELKMSEPESTEVDIDAVIARLDELVKARTHERARILRQQIEQDIDALVKMPLAHREGGAETEQASLVGV
jgi:predicted transcriptional regulator